MNDDLVSILTTFYRDYDCGEGVAVRTCAKLLTRREDIEKHLAMLNQVRMGRLELYAANFQQIPEDLRFFSDLINEIGRDQIAKTTEEQKFVINGLQLKALMRLAAVGRAALSDLTGGNKDA